MSVWFKSRLNPWYIWIPSNPNLYSTKIIMKMRWQTIASNVSIRTISPTATPLPKAYDCVAVYIAGRRTSLVVYGWWPQPPTKNTGLKYMNIDTEKIIFDEQSLSVGVYGMDLPVIYAIYRKASNIRRTKSQNLNVSLLVLELSLPNPCIETRC